MAAAKVNFWREMSRANIIGVMKIPFLDPFMAVM